jgi:hypothetical protein
MIRRALRTIALAAAVVNPWGTAVESQLIPVRTVPVASGDQFLLLPSQTLGMGGVRYAVDDSIGDPWTNPAKGAVLGTSAFFGAPTFYGISGNQGGGRSFPVSGIFSGSAWFGGASLALQQIENTNRDGTFFFAEPALSWLPPPTTTLSERFGRNLYASGFVGRRVTDQWSVGLGVTGSSLEAMDGVDLLYAGSERIEQSGSIKDFRVGAVHQGDADRLGLLLAHNRVSMRHDVTYFDNTVASQRRVEENEDKSRTWAGQASWVRDLTAPGWRMGASATANYKTHPKIPNYTIQNIPRDPGTTWAYEVGFGFAMTEESSTFAVDVALQPIWSNTWQEANAADVAASGGRLSLGDRSIENDFFFTNVVLRSGLSHQVGIVGLQTGVEVRSYDYQLEQANRVESTYREQDESWMEWSPTFGAVFGFPALDLRYGLRLTKGTGRPGTLNLSGPGLESLAAGGDADFILAPGGALTLQDATVVTQQLSVSIPIR